MKISIFIFFLAVSVIAKQPTEWQDADAAWLSNQIYEGVNTMNTDSGSVIYSHTSTNFGAFAIWKQKKVGDCYLVIRGTKTPRDFFTDLAVKEVTDNEIGVKVHSGVYSRSHFILNNIDDKLKVCNSDIIITGHSLGGAIAHYLFLLYFKRHFYDWGQKSKAMMFKAVMFGAPQLITKSNNLFLYINEIMSIKWYKYHNDCIPEIIHTIKTSPFSSIVYLFGPFLPITIKAYETVKTVSYGYYIPGTKIHLLPNGKKEVYKFNPAEKLSISDHVNLRLTVDLLTKIWQ